MEYYKYIQILGQQNKWGFFNKENTKERLYALTKIMELGKPSSIEALIPFLKDSNKEVQRSTCNVITKLFEKIKSKKGYYNTLRYCEISKSDIDYYSHNFSKEECITIYSIATMNSNGYVREKAIEKLAETNNENAIPFIVFRLADWVEEVRNTALKSIKLFKKKEFIDSLIYNLTIFEWLEKVKRTDLSTIHADIMNFVIVENKYYVLEKFTKYNDRTRIVIGKQIAASTDVNLNELKVLLKDKHHLVRNFAIQNFSILTQAEIDKLLVDKSARIRIQALYNLKNKENFSELIFPFLSDNSSSIRDFARYSLKNNVTDFAVIYNNNLLIKKNIVGSLFGLAETNGKKYTETVLPFLNDKVIRIRKSAFLTLKHLDNNKAYKFALENMCSKYVGIRNVIIEYFLTNVTPEVLLKAREIFANGNYEMKKSMLRLFSKIGKWSTIADLMIATIDKDADIRQLSLVYLQQWKNKAPNYFTQPQPGELERANQVFKIAFEQHELKKYFNQNPLTEINFYLR